MTLQQVDDWLMIEEKEEEDSLDLLRGVLAQNRIPVNI